MIMKGRFILDYLDENNYLVIQYQNVNGRVATYKFKSKDDTRLNEFWIAYDKEFNLFISNGHDKRPIIFNNILGAELFEEQLAEVVMIGGVAYKRMVLEPEQIDMNIPNISTKTYIGEWR